jgi:hypothetical protein
MLLARFSSGELVHVVCDYDFRTDADHSQSQMQAALRGQAEATKERPATVTGLKSIKERCCVGGPIRTAAHLHHASPWQCVLEHS